MVLPRMVLAAFIVVFVFAVITYGTTPRGSAVETRIDHCALILDRGGQQRCR